MDYTTVTLIFFVINLLIFVVATVAAYVAHDPVATQQLLELKAAGRLRRNAEKKVKLTEERLQQMQSKLHEVTSQRQKTFEQTRHEIDEIRKIVHRLISVYEQHNQRYRGSTKNPVCFEHYPQINTRDQRLDPHNENAQLEWEGQKQLDVAVIAPLPLPEVKK
jgi:TolA-binding protein